jgi:hypothetical protein
VAGVRIKNGQMQQLKLLRMPAKDDSTEKRGRAFLTMSGNI